MLFGHDVLVYASIAITVLVAWVLARTRIGLVIPGHRGQPPLCARPRLQRGGGPLRLHRLRRRLRRLAGAYLALAYTPQWIENMTAGRGWIALALVVFATWAPVRVAIGAYLFGTV